MPLLKIIPVDVYKRQAIYLSREITGLPLKTIGKSFGRNHSTVSASINKIEREIRKNSRMKATDVYKRQV